LKEEERLSQGVKPVRTSVTRLARSECLVRLMARQLIIPSRRVKEFVYL
jgi:hypothetical protein